MQRHIQICLSKLGHYINLIIRFAFLKESIAPWNSFRLMGSMLILDRFPAFGRSWSRWGSLVEHCSVVCVRHRVSINNNYCFASFAAYFLFFPKEKAFQSERKLMNCTPENRIPWLFTDYDNIKDFPGLFQKFPDFSWPWKIFVFLWLPWPWQPWILLWRKRRKIAAFH